jgi:hypothetical protein
MMATPLSSRALRYAASLPALQLLRRQVRNLVADKPTLYIFLRTVFTTREGNVQSGTQLLIEGYPRSANTFCEAAFRLAQGDRPVHLAHHAHAAATVLRASKRGIPTLVIMREPVEAARSLHMRNPTVMSPKRCLDEYIRFHNAIVPCRPRFVLARFETVVTDFGSVIDRVNKRFDTNFALFEHTEANVRSAYKLVDEMSGKRNAHGGPASYSPDLSGSDREHRDREKERVRSLFESKDLVSSVDEARDVYARMISGADV